MPEALPSVRSGVARSEGTSQSGCPVRFTHSVAAGAERASVLASVVAYVDLPECVAALLRQHLNGRTHGYVFETRSGKPKSDHNIADRHLIPLLEKLGIPHQPGQRFHAFRRFRTTVLRADAVPGKD